MNNFFELIQAPLKEKGALEKIGMYFVALIAIYIFLVPISIIAEISVIGLLVFYTFGVFFYILLFVVQNGYYYEYAQAGMEEREANKLWDMNIQDLLKKVGKLFLVQIIYSIPLAILWLPFGILAYVAGESESIGLWLLYIAGICFVYIVAFIYGMYVLVPAMMQLIKSNTFTKAFKFNEIVSNGIKSKTYNQLVLMQLIMAVLILFVFIANIILTFFIIGICLWPITFAALIYYGGIGLPYAVGSIYGKTA